MQTFLTKASQKKVKLIHFLLEADNGYTMDEIQQYIGGSVKSISLYMKELSELFKQFNGKIVLQNENNQRFCIQKEEDFPIYSIYLPYYKESYNYQLIDFMFKYPEKRIEDFAEKQYTSTSTVFRYAKLLVPYFKRYKIGFHSFKLEIEAEEINIRSFYYYFYWESTRDGRWPFLVDCDRIMKYVQCFEKTYGFKLDALQTKTLSFWLAIILERTKKQIISLDKEVKSTIESDPNFELVSMWLKESQLLLPDNERYFLYRVIYAFGIVEGKECYEQQAVCAHTKSQSLAYRLVELLSCSLKEVFDYDFDRRNQNHLFSLIAFYERSCFFWGNPDVFFNKSYISEVEKLDPQICRMVQKFHDSMIQIAPAELLPHLKNTHQLFLNYYYLLDYYGLLLKSIQPIKILLTDDLHRPHRLWLMNKIKTLFSNVYALSFFDSETKFEEVDLVISNYFLDTKNTPLLLMKNIPTERNWRNLEKILYELHRERATNK